MPRTCERIVESSVVNLHNLILLFTTNFPDLDPSTLQNPYPTSNPSKIIPRFTMATLPFTPSSSFTLTNQKQPEFHYRHSTSFIPSASHPAPSWRSCLSRRTGAYKVVIEHDGTETELEVDSDETILSRALDHGLSIPHDCKLGVCMTCPAKLISGAVDQSEGMLSDDVVERGYALLCASYPRSDCRIKTIPEEELLFRQLVTAQE